MANYEDVLRTFETEVQNEFGSGNLFFDNLKEDYVVGETNFLFRVVPLTAENMALGTRTQINGQAWLTIATPLDKGTRNGYKEADRFIQLLQNRDFPGPIFTYAGETVRVGNSGDGWFLLSARVPFLAT